MREILLNICLTAISLCLFKMLIPENAMKKQANFLIACFFLASMVFFFTSGRINFAYGVEFDINTLVQESIPYINFDEEFAEVQSRAIEREMRSKLLRVLAEEDIFPEEIYTSVNISDTYSISINEIRLVFQTCPQRVEQSSNQDTGATEESEEELEMLREAIHIVQKEVGSSILVTGKFKR